MRTSSLSRLLVLATAAVGLVGCGDSTDSAIHQPTPTAREGVSNETGRAGEPIRFADGMTVRVATARTARVIGEDDPQRAKGRFVVVTLKAVNRTGDDVSISDVRLRDGTGRWHSPAHDPAVEAFDGSVFLDYAKVPEYTPPNLSQGGDSAEVPDRNAHGGLVVFDVPRGAVRGSVLEVGYARRDISDPTGESAGQPSLGARARVRLGPELSG